MLKHHYDLAWLIIVCIAVAALFVVVLGTTGCTNATRTELTLRDAGYNEITITGWKPLTCSDSDQFATGFTATNPRGDKVSGTVCCGLVTCRIR
jgi:hypothetical protein